MIAFRPPAADFEDWVSRGAVGWGSAEMAPYYDRLLTKIVPVAPEHRNQYLADVVTAASVALAIPVRERWNDAPFADGVGFLEIGYDPATGARSSSSVAYLHAIMDQRSNLHTALNTRVLRIIVDDGNATGVVVRAPDGSVRELQARREIVACCGAIDTPRLLLLSGIGPAAQLRKLGIRVVADLAGVGENLSDHPEGLVVWEAAEPIPSTSATDWDIAIMLRLGPASVVPDILAHVPLMTYAVHAEARGVSVPQHSISMTPNVTRPRSRGRVWLASPDPDEPPRMDPRYLTDADDHDERVLLAGIQMARKVAATDPMSRWVRREVFPGPDVADGEELAAAVRATHHTVYHVSCTCRMGAHGDEFAVLDPELRVRGTRGLSVADASAFPSLTTVNPVVAVLMLAERAADLIAARTR
jgi:choline dehydrogenase-like flavoprotein